MKEEKVAVLATPVVAQVLEKKTDHPLCQTVPEKLSLMRFHQIDSRYIRLLQRFGPFGPKNMTPVFVATNVEVIDAVVLKEKHLRLILKQSGQVFSAIGFNLAERWKEIDNLFLDVAFQPDFNTWKDKTTIHLKLKDIRFPHNELSSN